MNFLAQVSGNIWQYIDFGTVIVCLMAALMLASGFYERKARKAAPEKSCAECMVPLVGQLESLMRTIQTFLTAHDSNSQNQNALHSQAHENITTDLTEIKASLNTILLNINGRSK